MLILSKWFNTPYLPTLNTTLNPICEGEGTKILFQSPKYFQAEHFRLKSCLMNLIYCTNSNIYISLVFRCYALDWSATKSSLLLKNSWLRWRITVWILELSADTFITFSKPFKKIEKWKPDKCNSKVTMESYFILF